MKKNIFRACLTLTLCLILSACSASPALSSDSTSSEITLAGQIQQALFEELSGKVPQAYNVKVDESNSGSLFVSLTMTDMTHISDFALWVNDLKTACQTVSEDFGEAIDHINLNVAGKDFEKLLAFTSFPDEYGMLIDYRFGEDKSIILTSYEELQEMFPASKLDDDQIIYPVRAYGSKYFDEAFETIPENAFSTTADENGLKGTVYKASVTIEENVDSENLTAVYALIDSHRVMIVSVPAPNEEDTTDYTLPSLGDTLMMYLTYMGFSEEVQVPIFIYGANEYLVNSLREETESAFFSPEPSSTPGITPIPEPIESSAPAPELTLAPTPIPSEPSNSEEKTGNLVWIPTNGGTKYHSNSSCSKMKDPIQVTEGEAKSKGYTPCKRCYG